MFEFLILTLSNRITENPIMFVFGKKEVEFMVFLIHEDQFAPVQPLWGTSA